MAPEMNLRKNRNPGSPVRRVHAWSRRGKAMVGGRGLMGRSADLGLIVLFAAMIAVPAPRMLLGPRAPTVASEFRPRAPLPSIGRTPRQLAGFPGRFEAYFNDSFGFRDDLIHWLSVAAVEGLRTSSSPKVVIGKKGWLFSGERLGVTNRQVAEPLTAEQLTRWQRVLEARRD